MKLSGKTIAVTGAGGFIGLRMVHRARERGMNVRGLDRSEAAAKLCDAAGGACLVGDVNDPLAASRLCSGADVVFHTAAVVTEDGSWDDFRRINVGGTRAIAQAARAAGVGRFVHLSSVMVYGFRYPRHVTEAGPLRGENNPYCQTKIESEEAALGFHEPGALEVIAIRPGDVYGPRGSQWVIRPIELMKQGFFVLPNDGRGIMNHVYVDNLLDAVFLALEKDETGQPFNVTDGAETTFAEYFNHLARMVGKAPLPGMPAPDARAMAAAMIEAQRQAGQAPQGSPAAIDFLIRPEPYSIERARRVLGYAPRVPLAEGMGRVEAWLRVAGMI